MKAQICHLFSALMLLAIIPILGIKAVYSQSITPAADTPTLISSPVHNPNQFDIGGGTQVGTNLFHSFQQFGLSQGQIANFLSHAEIQNILGRVVGGNPSLIQGLLQVSGGHSNLFLMNPAGIIFGANARLNVPAAFVATTANGIGIGNGWFNAIGSNEYPSLVGTPHSFAFLGPDAGVIVNAGMLRSGAGHSITLLGGTVVNTGTIEAPGGTITIAAIPGQRLVRITQAGSLLSLVLPTEAANALNSPSSAPLSLPALLTGGPFPEATGLHVENGVVSLTSTGQAVSTATGATTVSGTLSTATPTALSNPAQIQVVGDRVALLNAQINATGANGGLVRIGGDYQALGTLPKARITEVDANTIIRADGTGETGQGGTVVVWSTDTTNLAGTITATGAISGGNGGLVETSSQGTLMLAPTARISTRAPQGQTGTWLLDPPDLIVTTNGDAILSGGLSLTNTPTTATTIGAGAIAEGLALNQVNLQASNSITVDAAIDASLNPVANNLTLTTPTATLNQPITLAAGGTLSGTATTVTVNPGAVIQNGVDVATPGGTVNVAPGTYHVPGVANQVSITKPLTVQGAGAETTIIDGGGVSRGVYVDPGSDRTVNLDRLTIQQGHVAGTGGGILVNSGTLNLTNSTLTGNLAESGGGLYNSESAMINLVNSTLISNSADSDGGGIYNEGRATLTNSTLSGNLANRSGGGIYNLGDIFYGGEGIGSFTSWVWVPFSGSIIGHVTVTNSTLSGNSAGFNGGGIYNGGIINLANSTLSRNSARGGGGIYNSGSNSVMTWDDFGPPYQRTDIEIGNITLTNSTLSGNLAAGFRGGLYGAGTGGGIHNSGTVKVTSSTIVNNSANAGGGIYNAGKVLYMPAFTSHQDFAGTLTIGNSIIAGNTAASGRELSNLGSSTSEGYNLFGFNGSSGVNGMALSPTDIMPSVGIAQILTPLGNYGGPTQTHALVPRSPAINAGDPNLLTPDQRGFARLGRADIGAFEFQSVILPDAPTVGIWPTFSINLSSSDLNEIVAALYGREPVPLTVKLQPEPTPILCIDRTASETWHPLNDYHGLPDCQ